MTILRTYHSNSRNLAVTSFNTDTRIMRILFRSGYLYMFYGVSRGSYEAVANGAPRGGKEFWRRIAERYPYRQINRSGDIEDVQ